MDNICILDCKHKFHMECIKKIRRAACPVCNKTITELPKEILKEIQKRNDQDKEVQKIIHELDLLFEELNGILKRSQVIIMNTSRD